MNSHASAAAFWRSACSAATQRLSATTGMNSNEPRSSESTSVEAPLAVMNYITEGPSELVLQMRSPPKAASPWPAVCAALIVAAGVVWRLQQYVSLDWASRQIRTLLAVVGLGWWLFAPLGWLGLVIMVAAVVSSLTAARRKRARPSKGDRRSTATNCVRSAYARRPTAA